MEGFFFVFRFSPQTAILNSMRLAPIVSILVMSLALNAQTIQGKVVRISDGDTITILDEAKVQHMVRLNRIDAPEEGRSDGIPSVEQLVEMLRVLYRNVKVSESWEIKYALSKSRSKEVLLLATNL